MTCNSFVLWRNATGLLLNTWLFMQDGATPHTANTVLDFLHDTFSPIVISSLHHACTGCGHSPDINPCDFFLWGYLEDKVYANPINSVQHLHEVIVQEFNNVLVNMCRKACENVALRLQTCVDLGGAQVDHHLENR
jgi:hypothetical protein